ncbi:MAG: ATP-binding cassette domain-containing protein [Coriobacteriales bacterium]
MILHIEHLEMLRGERIAILGPNGSGKSTLIGLLTRDVRPLHTENPSVLLEGRRLWNLAEARTLFGVVSDALQEDYDRRLPVRDVVLSGYFGSIGLYRREDITAEMRAHADELIAELGITELVSRTMDTLSTGEARRALIARALVNDPRTLVLDEPCDGLDPRMTRAFHTTLRALASHDRGLVLVTHHVDDIIPEVDRVIMLAHGHIIADGPKRDVMTSERLSELFGFPAELEERNGVYRLW